MENYFLHETSIIDDNVQIGENTKIWHFCHIQSGAQIGLNCSLGQNVNISNNVKIGNGVKIQNNVSVYEGVELEDYVFCGPSMVFTNDLTPRAKYPKGHAGYKKTILHTGTTVGANATIVCGHELGEWCMIAAGAVVTKNVKKYYSKTFTTPSEIPSTYELLIYSNRYDAENGDYDMDTVRISNIKLEEGSKATPYVE